MKNSGDGALSYKSSNTGVVAVDANGKVSIKGCGTAKITVTAQESEKYYKTAKLVNITLVPKKVTSLKLKAGKKSMTASWKKDTKATGYQMTYAKNSKFTSGKKSITIAKNSTVKKTIKKLQKGKYYYVKVRAYKTSSGKKIYGSYSAAKRVKIK